MAVTPRDAATVVLLRKKSCPESGGFEVLMALRNRTSSFVPSSYVFPGGRVDGDDARDDMESFCSDEDLKRAQSMLERPGLSGHGLAVWIAAVRETFEEVGLLFAYGKDGSLLQFSGMDALAERYREYRRQIAACQIKFSEMLSREGLTFAFDRLHYFSHWITPELSPKRYDTRFFIAEAPPCQKALHDGQELTRHLWISPEAALEQYWQNRFHMVVPTIVTLEELSRFNKIGDVIESTKNKKIKSVMTRIVFDNGEIQEHAPDGRIFTNLVSPEAKTKSG